MLRCNILHPVLQMREINDATLAFQERLNSLWEEYRRLFDRMAATAAVSVHGLTLWFLH